MVVLADIKAFRVILDVVVGVILLHSNRRWIEEKLCRNLIGYFVLSEDFESNFFTEAVIDFLFLIIVELW